LGAVIRPQLWGEWTTQLVLGPPDHPANSLINVMAGCSAFDVDGDLIVSHLAHFKTLRTVPNSEPVAPEKEVLATAEI
jgi:hypothetical protein